MNDKVVGHASQRLILRRLLERERLPQAIMFSGSPGIGKSMCAFELARTLFCERFQESRNKSELYGGCGECAACRLFELGNLPDLFKFDCRDREMINAEAIRTLLYELNLKSFSGHRIVIFDNAEEMNTQSANILLKSIEEPRPGTHFLLISANPYRLPATLLSRCHILFFNQLSNPEVLEILERNKELQSSLASIYPDLANREWCELADGSFDNLVEFSAHAEEWLSIKEALSHISTGDLAAALELADKLAKEKGDLRVLLRLLQLEARRCMVAHTKEGSVEVWSILLTNLLAAEYLIFDRNIAPAYLLREIFLNLLPSPGSRRFTGGLDDVRLLETFLR